MTGKAGRGRQASATDREIAAAARAYRDALRQFEIASVALEGDALDAPSPAAVDGLFDEAEARRENLFDLLDRRDGPAGV